MNILHDGDSEEFTELTVCIAYHQIQSIAHIECMTN